MQTPLWRVRPLRPQIEAARWLTTPLLITRSSRALTVWKRHGSQPPHLRFPGILTASLSSMTMLALRSRYNRTASPIDAPPSQGHRRAAAKSLVRAGLRCHFFQKQGVPNSGFSRNLASSRTTHRCDLEAYQSNDLLHRSLRECPRPSSWRPLHTLCHPAVPTQVLVFCVPGR